MSKSARPSGRLSQVKRELLASFMAQEGMDSAATERIPRRKQFSPCPLSFAQQRLWFLNQLEPGSAAYNNSTALRLKGRVDVKALERTLNEIVRRHEVLRTRVGVVEGQPVQLVAGAQTMGLGLSDLWGLAARERDVAA